jgi:hypothetical protein
MHRFPRATAAVAAAAISSVLFLSAAPAGAVVGGTDDTANQFANVGVLQLQIEGEWFDFCSGTLVAGDVVLTAAHCTDFFGAEVGDPEDLGPDDLRVSFDPDPDETSTYFGVDHLVVHPDWFAAPPCLGNSKRLCLAPPAEDIALVFLAGVVAGVEPAPIASLGYLDGLDMKSETFTVVGYGVDEFTTGSFFAPHAVVVVDGIRSYREVSATPARDAFPDRFVKITQSTCFGDSGGPLFHDGTVVGINTWTFSVRCSGPNFAYRTDSAVAQAFLGANL